MPFKTTWLHAQNVFCTLRLFYTALWRSEVCDPLSLLGLIYKSLLFRPHLNKTKQNVLHWAVKIILLKHWQCHSKKCSAPIFFMLQSYSFTHIIAQIQKRWHLPPACSGQKTKAVTSDWPQNGKKAWLYKHRLFKAASVYMCGCMLPDNRWD